MPAKTRTTPPAVGTDVRPRRVRGLDPEQRREQRRRSLLAATLTLLGEKGPDEASIERICQAASVSTKSFYELFDSKADCFLALFEDLAAGILEDMAAARLNGVTGPEELIDEFARSLLRDPRVPTVLFLRSTVVSGAVERRRRENRRAGAQFLRQVWHDAIAPDQATRDLDVLTVGFVGGMFELVSDWLHDHDSRAEGAAEELAARLRMFHATVYRGLTAADAPA